MVAVVVLAVVARSRRGGSRVKPQGAPAHGAALTVSTQVGLEGGGGRRPRPHRDQHLRRERRVDMVGATLDGGVVVPAVPRPVGRDLLVGVPLEC